MRVVVFGAGAVGGHLQDFERDRPPEIDGLLTAVQAFARAAGIATPTLDAITALVIEKARRMGLYAPAVWESSGIALPR